MPHLGSANSGGTSQAQLQSMQLEALGNPFQHQRMSGLDQQPMMDFLDAPGLMQAEAVSSGFAAPNLSMSQPLFSSKSGVDLSSLRYDVTFVTITSYMALVIVSLPSD